MNVITILESDVAQKDVPVLVARFTADASSSTDALKPLASYLVRQVNSARWRIISVWKDMATLESMRSSGETPVGVRIFRAAGVEPTLTIHQAEAQVQLS